MSNEELEQSTNENPEEFVAEETGGQQPEAAAPKERTKESEIKANIELWRGLGIEVDEADVRHEIEAIPEVKGYDCYVYMPKRVRTPALIGRINKIFNESDGTDFFEITDYSNALSRMKMPSPRTSDSSYAIAIRPSEEPDEDSIGENAMSAVDWEALPDEYMTLRERLVAGFRIYSESGKLLDPTGFITIFPHERSVISVNEEFKIINQVPLISRNMGREKLYDISSHYSDRSREMNGIRRVITKNTTKEVAEKYRQEAQKKTE